VKLFAFERRWLCAIFDAVLPGSEDPRFPLGAAALGVERYIDALMRSCPRGFALGLRVCTWLLQLAPVLVLGRPALFGALPASERTEVLERLSHSDRYLIRELPMLFKTAACLGPCGLPDVQRRIGIHPVDTSDPDWARDAQQATARGLPVVTEPRS
jgi:hypothetical protein